MGTARTAWHVNFAHLVQERAPPGIQVQAEVQLSSEPQRADLLLLRRAEAPRRDEEARVLRGLWPRLASDTLVEFKSVSRPLRRGDLLRLLGYGVQYHAAQLDRPLRSGDLTLALIDPSRTPTLRDELAFLGWTLAPLGGGYGRIDGREYTLLVAIVDEVADAEGDDLLGSFGHRPLTTPESRFWWNDHLIRLAEDTAMQNLEGYDEMLQKLLEKLPPEQRLAGLAPEQRLAGLAPEQLVPALPDDVLRGLSDEYLRSLPAQVQEAIRSRLGRRS